MKSHQLPEIELRSHASGKPYNVESVLDRGNVRNEDAARNSQRLYGARAKAILRLYIL